MMATEFDRKVMHEKRARWLGSISISCSRVTARLTPPTVHIAPTADHFLAFIGAVDEALRRLADTTERLVESRTALGGTSQDVQRFYKAVDRASDEPRCDRQRVHRCEGPPVC
jgi:hypothetical protein